MDADGRRIVEVAISIIKKVKSALQVPLPYILDDADQYLDRGADEALPLFGGPKGGVAVGALVGRLVDPPVAGDLAGALGLRWVAVLLQAVCFDPFGMQEPSSPRSPSRPRAPSHEAPPP